ncbi:MAG: T9SS type A sorting domain-containing protein [Bacteroidetes bacterium]|nr:T9SS type A sorting domain-containing protein [Bacteroidota bacterium]
MGSIWSTNDAGMNWMLVDSSYSDQLTDILIVNDSLAFAVGMNGKILRNKALFGSVGIEEVKQESVSIFPNPFSKYIKIVRDEKHQNSSISILNSSGMLVSKETLLSGKQWIVDTSLWSSGVYFLRIVYSERSTIHKIIKIE